jgi:hypothetical protein
MADSIQHEMHRSGATTGAKTGRLRSYDAGETLVAPEGEFAHLPEGAYTTREASYRDRSEAEGGGDASAVASEASDWTLGQHEGGGWYRLRYEGAPIEDPDGEPATVGRGEDNARSIVQALNDKDISPEEYLA